MRAVALCCLALLVAAVSASLKAPKDTPSPSPWTITTSWQEQLPDDGAMQINPAYSSIPGMYFTTSRNGTVFGVNSSNHAIAWTAYWPDLSFIEAIPALNGLVVGTGSGTWVLQANTGGTVWSNANIKIMSDLTNHGDRNFIMFDSVMVYRETALGYTRVCTLDIYTGNRRWCDHYRVIGLPDAALNNTFTAPLFDESGLQYACNFDVATGAKNWIIQVDTVMTGNPNFVAVANSTGIFALNSMTGYPVSGLDIGAKFTGSSVMVHDYILAFSNGQWVGGMNMNSGELMWNVSLPSAGLRQLQHRGNRVLILASLDKKSTNFTRIGAYEGNLMWTAIAKPTGMSLTPVHGWLGNDILYCVTTSGWAAYGVDTGDLIESGSGNLFLPRSSAPDYLEPHVGYFVTGPEGIVYHLKIVKKQ